MKKNKFSLVSTLGISPAVIWETILYFQKRKNILFDNITLINTSGSVVKDGIKRLKNHISGNYPKTNIKSVEFPKPDTFNLVDNKEMLNLFLKTLSDEKQNSGTLLLSIAGGRKTMSALVLLAGYLIGVDGIYHILANVDERKYKGEKEFFIPLSKLRLIKLPDLNISGIFNEVVKDFDINNIYKGNFLKYFSDSGSTYDVFDKINSELNLANNFRKYKAEYEKKYNTYEQMCFIVKSIINREISKNKLKILSVTSRVKTFDSFYEKIFRKQKKKKKPISDPFTEIHDIAGVKVICLFESDARELVNILKKSKEFDKKSNNFKFQEIKQDFGYKASHFDAKINPNSPILKIDEFKKLKDIFCEIQIKTSFNDSAQRAEHRLRYKSDSFNSLKQSEKDYINSSFITIYDKVIDLDKKVNKLKKFDLT